MKTPTEIDEKIDRRGMNGNKIILGDCIDVMKGYQDKSVDLILTDPPYGLPKSWHREKCKTKSKLAKHKLYDVSWDIKIRKEYFDEIFRVSRNQIIFGGNYYANWLPPSSCWIVWDKDNSGCFADCELAWTSFPTAVRKFKWRWNGMLQQDMRNKEYRYHAAQKPIVLMKWILANYAKKGDIILDPFSGSGSTLIACKEMGFSFIGIDINPEYNKIAELRLAQEVIDFNMVA